MSHARERFRQVLSQPTCTVAANIFDPLSARIAHLLDYDVCFLSGSVGKVANLGVPDIVLSNLSDAVDHCRRMTRMADVSLMVDGEDGFGNAVNVMRTVKELEAAGVSAIEIEDNIAPVRFNAEDPGLHATAEQVGKLEAANDWIALIEPARSSSAELAVTSVVPEARLSECCPLTCTQRTHMRPQHLDVSADIARDDARELGGVTRVIRLIIYICVVA